MPSYLHIHTQTCRLLLDIAVVLQLFFSSASIIFIHEWGVCLVFPQAFLCALLPLFCSPFPGLGTFFFFLHLSLRGNDFWLRVGGGTTNISYPWTQLRCTLHPFRFPICPGCCQNFVSATFDYSTKSPHYNVCGWFSEIFNKWHWSMAELGSFMWVHMCKCTFCQQFNSLWH